jgi:hypothetical protein
MTMEGRPIKFRLLELFSEKGSWNYEIVKQLQAEYDMKTSYGRDSINWDIIELAAGGMLTELEIKIDEDGSLYAKNALLTKYTISSLGKDVLADLTVNLSHRRK